MKSYNKSKPQARTLAGAEKNYWLTGSSETKQMDKLTKEQRKK